ncbi:MAG: UDP-N-acetylmuramoyl-L-alanine--D-glutamate ligase [bacterium]|nr:UDP-N-acetylmuramoyl-L-alanine--D-glutamate ligase [bacterium]
MLTNLSGRKFGILGVGKSGIGAAGLVKRLGGTALISDIKPREKLGDAVAKLEANGIEVETGEHSRLVRELFDTIVISPGATLKPDWLQTWQQRGIGLWSELELASLCYDGKWIGVTGSNGKTTTVTLLTAMLNASGIRAQSVGNIGTAWSDCLPARDVDVFVVEVSSFQMEMTHSARPDICVILNILENHLDRHGDIETYGNLKLKLAANQNSRNFFVYNTDDVFLANRCGQVQSAPISFGSSDSADILVKDGALTRIEGGETVRLLHETEWSLEGKHNLLNAAAAAAAAKCAGATDVAIHSALVNAKPVEHRIEFVSDVNSIRYINDSKSTNLTATLTAIEAVRGTITLLFGGRPKHENFAPLSQLLGNRLGHLIVFGEARAKVNSELVQNERIHYCENLDESFRLANQITHSGQAVLLSPGCASYDQYSNYEQRGEHFKTLVKQL